jgi:hypothetical protein
MLRKVVMLVVILAAIGAAAFSFITMPARVSADALGSYTPNLDNGKTMFYAGGCASCHATPNQDDKTKLGGGLGLKSPFGTFYPPNISPDRNDGIGGWSEADFVTAMWKGIPWFPCNCGAAAGGRSSRSRARQLGNSYRP